MAKQNALPNSNIRPPFGRKIAELRKSRDMTLAHIAQICGVSEATMSRIETGKTDISAHHLFLLALANMLLVIESACYRNILFNMVQFGTRGNIRGFCLRNDGLQHVVDVHEFHADSRGCPRRIDNIRLRVDVRKYG